MYAILANAGSALASATTVHLVLGNLLIGIFEGGLVSKIFKTPRLESITIITIANYASAWLGVMILGATDSQFDLTIGNAKLFLGATIIASFLLTLLIESLFFYWVTCDLGLSGKRLWKNLTFIHLASYSIIILPWYLTFSNLSLLKLKVVEVEKIATEPLLIAYLSPDNQKATLYDLSQSKEIETFPANETFLSTDGYIIPSQEFKNIAPVNADQKILWDHWHPEYHTPALSLRDNETLEFLLERSSGQAKSLILKDSSQNLSREFQLQSPGMIWPTHEPTQIRDSLVLFQLDDDQICLADFRKMTIALLGRGSRPVVVTKVSAP